MLCDVFVESGYVVYDLCDEILMIGCCIYVGIGEDGLIVVVYVDYDDRDVVLFL